MLRRIRSAGRPGNDAGVATSVLVMGMAVALAAGFLAFGRIAQAGDMRNQAQIGADAAALGTLAPLRDQAVDMLLQGIEPSAAGYWLVGAPPKSAAEKYADENDVHTTDVRLSGTLGNTAMVKVATDRCQLKNKDELTEKEKDDLRHKRNLCTDSRGKKGIGRSGTAQAIAKMFAPDCEYIAAPPPARRTPASAGSRRSSATAMSRPSPTGTGNGSPSCSRSAWSTTRTRSSTTACRTGSVVRRRRGRRVQVRQDRRQAGREPQLRRRRRRLGAVLARHALRLGRRQHQRSHARHLLFPGRL